MDHIDQCFESPEGLVTHARDHTEHLDREIDAFFETKPYTRIVEYDAKTGQDVHKIRIAKLPAKLGRIFKDVTSNLRDALDHAVYASAVSLGAVEPRNTAFPFANDAAHLKGELGRWVFDDVPSEIHPILCSFQPYKGGNDTVVALNRIRNPNTHRIIVPMGTASMGQDINFFGDAAGLQMGYSIWDTAKNEVEFFRIRRGFKFNAQVNFAFDVALGNVEIVAGQPVVSFCRAATTEVDRIVSAIKAETVRIWRERNP